MKKFGLLGKTLKHSYSPQIHKLLAKYSYELIELEPSELENFVKSDRLDGFNVTIPYKQEIIKYLDNIDESAKEMGAVNTVVKKGDKFLGYNTDCFGMEYALKRANIPLKDKCVMILGSGGTSLTAQVVAKNAGAKKIFVVSRNGKVNYQNCYDCGGVEVIINATPVGTYPNTHESLIDLSRFNNLMGVFDVIYNPSLTKLLYQAKELGINYSNGLPMLVAQAKKAMELFEDKKQSDDIIESIINNIKRQTLNVVLVGMPGAGKTTIAKLVAKRLNRQVIDTDEIITKSSGLDIPTIFSKFGENYFRDLESQALSDAGKLSNKVISVGGGSLQRQENLFSLKQNGIVFYIQRDLERLSTDGRPLSKDLNALKELFQKRKESFIKASDFVVDNNVDIDLAVKGVIDSYENFSD